MSLRSRIVCAYVAIRFACIMASSHVLRVFHARPLMTTCHLPHDLMIRGLLIEQPLDSIELESRPRTARRDNNGCGRVTRVTELLGLSNVFGEVAFDVGDSDRKSVV